jgi:hypothetical protein
MSSGEGPVDLRRLAERGLSDAREEYALQMDHIAKYAAQEARNVRDGVFPDEHAGVVLSLGVAAYRRCQQASRVLVTVIANEGVDT